MAPSRWALAAVALLFTVAGALAFAGELQAAEHLGVPTMQPAFADLRVLTAAAQATREGLDPLQSNPGDPWGRLFNYPRVWLLLGPLGVAPEHTTALALLVWGAAALGLVWLARQVDRRLGAWTLALSVLSPVWALALERANTDLVIFGLLVAAAAMYQRRPASAVGVVGVAALLKLFPIAALGLVAERGVRARARLAAGAVLVAFACYAFATRADLARIAANTQHWPPLSHGVSLAPQWMVTSLGWPAWAAWGLVALSLASVGALALWLRAREGLVSSASAAQSVALRIGAGLHGGAFLLGSSFDYRLIFLTLATPGLSIWVSARSPRVRWLARTALAASLLSVWSLAWRIPLGALIGPYAARTLEEGVTWACWASMACVFALASDFSAGGSAGSSFPSGPQASARRPARSPRPRSPA